MNTITVETLATVGAYEVHHFDKNSDIYDEVREIVDNRFKHDLEPDPMYQLILEYIGQCDTDMTHQEMGRSIEDHDAELTVRVNDEEIPVSFSDIGCNPKEEGYNFSEKDLISKENITDLTLLRCRYSTDAFNSAEFEIEGEFDVSKLKFTFTTLEMGLSVGTFFIIHGVEYDGVVYEFESDGGDLCHTEDFLVDYGVDDDGEGGEEVYGDIILLVMGNPPTCGTSLN